MYMYSFIIAESKPSDSCTIIHTCIIIQIIYAFSKVILVCTFCFLKGFNLRFACSNLRNRALCYWKCVHELNLYNVLLSVCYFANSHLLNFDILLDDLKGQNDDYIMF